MSLFKTIGIIIVLALAPEAVHAAARCERPAKPAFPDPKTVDPDVAQKLDMAMQKYAAATSAYVQCLEHEAAEAEQDGTNTIDFYNQKFLPEYNKRAAVP